MTPHKSNLEKFNVSNDFTLWKVEIKALFVQQGCETTLEGDAKLPKDMKAKRKVDIRARAHNSIFLCLTDEVLREVMYQTSTFRFWEKLCDKYQNNCLKNMLYQRQCVYTLRMFESTLVNDHHDNLSRI